jgi:uncharacterized protein (TIGR00369 family)
MLALRSRTVSWSDPLPLAAARRGSSGLEFFRAIAAGQLPQPPMYRLLGFHIAAIREGGAQFVGERGGHLCDLGGLLHGGYLTTLLDSACGVAVQSTLPRGSGTATVRLEVCFFVGLEPSGDALACQSHILHRGRSLAWSQGEVRTAQGELAARARGVFAIFTSENGRDAAAHPAEISSRDVAWNEPAPGADAPTLAAIVAGTAPQPPICATIGARLVSAGDSRALCECVPASEHYNPMGGVHGGLAGMLLELAANAAVLSSQHPDRHARPVTLAIDYFRPISRDTGLLRAEGRIGRAGVRICLAGAALADPAGTTYARAALTYAIAPKGEPLP